MSPIALSDAELTEVMQAARLVPHDLRQAYLEQVATKLRGKDLGPGLVHRVAFEVARSNYVERGAGGELGVLGMPNPYSRAEWTELQLPSFVHRETVPPSAPGCATMLRRRRPASSSLRYSFSGASLACGRGAPASN